MKRTELKRTTPLRRRGLRPRRLPTEGCSVRGCTRPVVVIVTSPSPLGQVGQFCKPHAKHEADHLARGVVLARDDGRCVCCGRGDGELDWAHVIRRSQSLALHWDTDNSLILCRADHDRFDGSEKLWRAWLDENRPGLWDRLDQKRRVAIREGRSPDYAEIIASLRSQASGLVR